MENLKNYIEYLAKTNGTVCDNLNTKRVNIVHINNEHGFEGTFKDALKSAREWAKEYFSNTESKHNFQISPRAIEEFLSEKNLTKSVFKKIHLCALKNLTEIICNSICCEHHPDYIKVNKVRGTDKTNYTNNYYIKVFYGAVEYEDKIYRSKIRVKANDISENIYCYYIEKIELNMTPDKTNLIAQRSDTQNSISLAKIIKNIEKSYDKGKFLLDESKNSQLGNIDELKILNKMDIKQAVEKIKAADFKNDPEKLLFQEEVSQNENNISSTKIDMKNEILEKYGQEGIDNYINKFGTTKRSEEDAVIYFAEHYCISKDKNDALFLKLKLAAAQRLRAEAERKRILDL